MTNFQFSSHLTYWQHLTWMMSLYSLKCFLHVALSTRHSCRLLLLNFICWCLWGSPTSFIKCSRPQSLVFSFLSKFTPLMILLIPKAFCTIYMASIPNFIALVLLPFPNCSIVYLTDRCFDFTLSKTAFLIFPAKTSPWSLNQLKWCQRYLSICSVWKLRSSIT